MTEDMPKTLKFTMTFIDRVGFPTLAFLLMSYMCFVTLHKITEALTENTRALSSLAVEFREHHVWAKEAILEIRGR